MDDFSSCLCVNTDPGQTYNSSEVLSRMIRDQPDLLLLGGDFSYADDWIDVDQPISWDVYGKYTCECTEGFCAGIYLLGIRNRYHYRAESFADMLGLSKPISFRLHASKWPGNGTASGLCGG